VGDAWLIVLERPEGKMDNLKVQLELLPSVWEDEIGRQDKQRLISSKLSDELGLRVDVEICDPNSLPRFERKAARVVDKREA
jgi:phenylacetate-CoA ligase